MENILTLGKLLSLWFCFLLHSILFLISQTSYRTYKIDVIIQISTTDARSPICAERSTFLVMIIIIIIISMNKSQELTVFHGRQKLTSAKNERPEK